MTPNNIVNMAKLLGLDVIALTDHNCAANVRAVAKLAKEAGLIFLPSLELNTAEEVHLLAYFSCAEQAEEFGEAIYRALPEIPNNEAFFGRQLILDDRDEIIGKKDKLLISALPYTLEECVALIREAGGKAVPAHINKEANSLIANLGFLPENPALHTVELAPGCPLPPVDLHSVLTLCSSDAHYLENISEKEHFLESAEADAAAVLEQF